MAMTVSQRWLLERLERLMAESISGEVKIVLHEGGVRDVVLTTRLKRDGGRQEGATRERHTT